MSDFIKMMEDQKHRSRFMLNMGEIVDTLLYMHRNGEPAKEKSEAMRSLVKALEVMLDELSDEQIIMITEKIRGI